MGAGSVGTMVDELRAIIKAQWPDIGDVWRYEHIAMVPWDDVGKDYDGAAFHPFACIIVEEPHDADMAPMDAQAHDYPVTILGVWAFTGDPASIEAKGETLHNYLWVNDWLEESQAQVLQVSPTGAGIDLWPNRVFVDKNYPHRAGGVRLLVELGEF
jgi:hypothetical protein